MTITISIDDATLPELLAKVEAGEEVILLRNNVPVARMAGVELPTDKQELVETIIRERASRQQMTQAEIADWKQIGRR